MKISKILFGTMIAILLTAIFNISFAKAKDHDGEIIAYMVAINNGEVKAATEAKNKKIDANVLEFSNMMITQHTENLKQLMDLSQKINIAADETAAVQHFMEKSDKEIAKLSKIDDNSFQEAYVHAMIKDHTKALKMITGFISDARNADLKQYLVDTKKAVEQHLADAKQLK